MSGRYGLTDFEWELIKPHLPNKPRGVLRTGDLPERYGSYTTCYDRFRRWTAAGVWDRLVNAITEAHEGDVQMIDGSLVRGHQWDEVLMFKALVLAELFGLSDEGLERPIADRLTFMRFLGLGLEDGVPDARTIWSYRERLTEREGMEALFAQFGDYLRTAGSEARDGQLIDASRWGCRANATRGRRTPRSAKNGRRKDGRSGRSSCGRRERNTGTAQESRQDRV